ncbi:MAG: Imidazole glycerol phosphate synthase subunit HisH [Bryobacteraceae bacterium]|nr:Imidazole glycerol phosphate synthase subunit HisH [Bryobacteraceae bacterium]MCC6345091.1 imidazole glycerol phosphate synthase subunit HisH [Bryobacterales bacterium]
MIAIIDYGAGNLRSVQNTLAQIGSAYRIVHTPEQLRAASKIILPGVGHFGQMMRALEMMEMRDAIRKRIENRVPFLGICLGLQAMYETSEEAPELRGLGILQGSVKRFASDLRVPHMGWNEIVPREGSALLGNLGPHPYLYFAHSYYAPSGAATAAICEYGIPYTAAIETGNLFGVQFHPEKSGTLGLRVMKNFVDL